MNILAWLSAKKRKVLVALAAVCAFILIFWLFTHSRVSIDVSNGGSDEEIAYYLRNTGSGETKQIKSSANNVTTWVKRGSYEISANNSKGNFIEFVPSTPLFFSTQHITGELKPERARTFVGDAVRPCSAMAGSILVSGGCDGVYGELSIHIPATNTSPTYVLDNPDRTVFGQNQILISSGDRPIQVIKSSQQTVEGSEENASTPKKYVAVIFASKSAKSKNVEIPELAGTEQYYFESLNHGGFIAYKDNPEVVFEYNSSAKKVSEAKLEKPQTSNIGLAGIDYLTVGSYATLYSTSADTESSDAVSEAVVTKDSNTSRYVFKGKHYSNLMLCGTNKLCLLGGESGMDVYDISTAKAKLDFTVYGVSSIARSSGGQLLAINDNGVLSIDVDSKKGYTEYSLGGYVFNEINIHKAAYVLRLTDDKGRTVGLHIDQSAVDADSIDKKRLELQKLAEVKFVSVYRDKIYISAELGEPIFNDASQGYIYNPETKSNAAAKINAEIDRLGIDRSKYTITSNAF